MRRAIERKRDGETLDPPTWHALIESYMSGDIDDAQMAALAMACVWRGLDEEEAAALTGAMVASGAVIQYPPGMLVVDKHSSGGVSDLVSLVVVPLVAACGVHVAKLSGRALGHTGGTIDKLEALDGFDAALPMHRFVDQVQRVGCAIAAQTESLVPADKRLYHLRDRTGTVPSIGLIASSIVSKKIAGGASAFVFDVKCGSAAFMHNPQRATALAEMLVGISRRFGKRAHAIVSDMNQPLGRAIGTGLEVIEARDLLRGVATDERAREACLVVASAMLEVGGVAQARDRAVQALESGAAYEKFAELIEAQGSSPRALEALAPSAHRVEIAASHAGFVAAIDAVALGNAARHRSERDRAAGIEVQVRTGDAIAAGAPLATLFGEGDDASAVAAAFTIAPGAPASHPLVYTVI